jgi:hypothetical protein
LFAQSHNGLSPFCFVVYRSLVSRYLPCFRYPCFSVTPFQTGAWVAREYAQTAEQWKDESPVSQLRGGKAV